MMAASQQHTIKTLPPSPPAAKGMDPSRDDVVTPLDALLVINAINAAGTSGVAVHDAAHAALDINGDGFITPLDALLVINYLNQKAAAVQALTAPKAVLAVAAPLDTEPAPHLADSAVERDVLRGPFWDKFDDPPASGPVSRAKHIGNAAVALRIASTRRGGRLEPAPLDAVIASTEWDFEI